LVLSQQTTNSQLPTTILSPLISRINTDFEKEGGGEIRPSVLLVIIA
jgi:hypothetical protein